MHTFMMVWILDRSSFQRIDHFTLNCNSMQIQCWMLAIYLELKAGLHYLPVFIYLAFSRLDNRCHWKHNVKWGLKIFCRQRYGDESRGDFDKSVTSLIFFVRPRITANVETHAHSLILPIVLYCTGPNTFKYLHGLADSCNE